MPNAGADGAQALMTAIKQVETFKWHHLAVRLSKMDARFFQGAYVQRIGIHELHDQDPEHIFVT